MRSPITHLSLVDPNNAPILSLQSKPVSQPSGMHIQELVGDIVRAFVKRRVTGVIAGPQVSKLVRIIVIMRRSSIDSIPIVFMNPMVSYPWDEMETKEETFLGEPTTIQGLVKRYTKIEVTFTNTHGETKTMTLEGETARLFQQGHDTTQGILFTNRINQPENEPSAVMAD